MTDISSWMLGGFFKHNTCKKNGLAKLISVSADLTEVDFSRTGYMRLATEKAAQLLEPVKEATAEAEWIKERTSTKQEQIVPLPKVLDITTASPRGLYDTDYYEEQREQLYAPLTAPGTGRRSPAYLKKR